MARRTIDTVPPATARDKGHPDVEGNRRSVILQQQLRTVDVGIFHTPLCNGFLPSYL